jgi:hypothetical protein
MNPKYFKPELGKPYVIALKYPTGRIVKGFQGPELRWTLMDGQAFYTPLDFQAKIEDLSIKPGQRFQIEKRIVNRKAEWIVSHVSDVPDLQPKPPQKAIALIEAAGALGEPEETLGGTTHRMPERPATALETALKTAVTAAAEAERHGQKIGYNVRFQSGDIKSMAISVLIGMQSGRAA